MPIIVQHIKSKKPFVFLGTSYSYFYDSSPSFFGGNLFPREEEGEFELVAVSDANGDIGWFSTSELKVIAVDGKTPGEILAGYKNNLDDTEEGSSDSTGGIEECPGCGEKVKAWDRVCPNCELTLIQEEE